MEVNTTRCKECKGEMKLGTLAALAGEERGVRVRIEGMPAMQCAQGHKRFVAPDFAVRLMNALLADKQLDAPGAGSVQARRQLALPGLDAFGVDVELPKLRCASCGGESIPPQKTVVDGLMKATSSAFRSAQISPI